MGNLDEDPALRDPAGGDVHLRALMCGERGTTTGVGDAAGLPGPSIDHACYPNPFNPMTTIRFDLPAARSVSLTVFDLRGRRIETLVDNEQRSAGEHRITWDASNRSSGTYFYRLDTDGRQEIGKMQLIK